MFGFMKKNNSTKKDDLVHEKKEQSQIESGKILKDLIDRSKAEKAVDENLPPLDVVRFGSFAQKLDTDEPQPIEWYCLTKREGKMLLLSKYALDISSCFVKRFVNVEPWQKSRFRERLNGSFYNQAFSPEEKKHIVPEIICNDHEDNVFLLSEEQYKLYLRNRREKFCLPTQRVEYMLKHQQSYFCVSYRIMFQLDENEYCMWWLRDEDKFGGYKCVADMVSSENSYCEYRMGAEMDVEIGVRPALWVKEL